MMEDQRFIVFLGAGGGAGSLLYLPWCCVSRSGDLGPYAQVESQLKYGWLWEPPTASGVSLDVARLLIEWTILAVVFGSWFLAVRTQKPA